MHVEALVGPRLVYISKSAFCFGVAHILFRFFFFFSWTVQKVFEGGQGIITPWVMLSVKAAIGTLSAITDFIVDEPVGRLLEKADWCY